jgi:parvulin-like peptidyl-prolyl isomerase
MHTGNANNRDDMILTPRKGACLRKRKHGARPHVADFAKLMVGGVCLTVLLLGIAGCTGHRKAELTEEEIRQHTLAHRPDRPDELLVSGEKVTCDDVLSLSPEANASPPTLKDKLIEMAKQMPREPFMREARPVIRQRLNSNIATIVLYKRARKELGAKTDEQLDQMMEKELRKFTVEHGGTGAATDTALQEMGMSRERFKEYKKKQLLSWYYVTSKFPYNRPITHGELLEYYDKMKAESFFQAGAVQFRLIDIQITKVRLSGANDDPIQVARALAKDVMERVRAGEDFGELAKKYSNEPRGASGGLWPQMDPDALAAPYDVLGEKAKEMKPGEVAGPIEALDHIFIMKLEKKQEKGYRPLTEVQETVEEQIMADRRSEASYQLNEEIKQLAAAGNTDRFVEYCLQSLYSQAHAPAQAR